LLASASSALDRVARRRNFTAADASLTGRIAKNDGVSKPQSTIFRTARGIAVSVIDDKGCIGCVICHDAAMPA